MLGRNSKHATGRHTVLPLGRSRRAKKQPPRECSRCGTKLASDNSAGVCDPCSATVTGRSRILDV